MKSLPLHADVKLLSVEMRRVADRMESTGRRLNNQKLIDHAKEVVGAAEMAECWSLHIRKEKLE